MTQFVTGRRYDIYALCISLGDNVALTNLKPIPKVVRFLVVFYSNFGFLLEPIVILTM